MKREVESKAPVCEIECVHTETVNRVRPIAEAVVGVGELFALLADQTRLKIVYGLAHSELCVCDAAAIAEVTTAAASYHLRLLHKAGLVEYRRDGRLVYYRLSDDSLRELVEAAHAFTART